MSKNSTVRPCITQLLADTIAGKYTGVFIDDSGLPGLYTGTGFITSDRKTWVAVIVPPNLMPEIYSGLTHSLSSLHEQTGAVEFHFADIYAGRKEFKGVDLNYRLACFDLFAKIFAKHKLPIFVQSFEPSDLARLREDVDLPDKFGILDLHKADDAAFFFLMKQVHDHLVASSSDYGVPARVFVDEGRLKEWMCMRWPFEDIFADGLVCFMSSARCIPVQLADFAAFALTRNQWIMVKSEKKDIDFLLVAILSRLGSNFRNISKIPISDISQMTLSEYARITGQIPGIMNGKKLAHIKWKFRAIIGVVRNMAMLHWRPRKYFWRSLAAILRGSPDSDSPLEITDEFYELVDKAYPQPPEATSKSRNSADGGVYKEEGGGIP